MGNVADEGNGQAFNPPFAAKDRENIKQPLRRMFVGAVAGIDHTARHVL